MKNILFSIKIVIVVVAIINIIIIVVNGELHFSIW